MNDKKLKNNFTKALLQSYNNTNCERRLFHELAKNKPDLWLNPVRKLERSKRIPQTHEYLQELGKRYEQLVYAQLKQIPNTYYREQGGEVDKSYLTPSKLLDFGNRLLENDYDIILLEFVFLISFTPLLCLNKLTPLLIRIIIFACGKLSIFIL